MEGKVDSDLMIEALMESVDILRTENEHLRNSNRILRTVFRQLRAANESLRRTVEIARLNDETFVELCNGGFDAPALEVTDGGLPEVSS